MKIEINCRALAAITHVFEITILVCIVVIAIGRAIGTEIEAMDPIEMTWLIMLTYLGVLWLLLNKLRHDAEKIAEKEDEKNDDDSGDNRSNEDESN